MVLIHDFGVGELDEEFNESGTVPPEVASHVLEELTPLAVQAIEHRLDDPIYDSHVFIFHVSIKHLRALEGVPENVLSHSVTLSFFQGDAAFILH